MLHRSMTGEQMHTPFRWVVADQTAREALSVTSDDEGKIAWQLDDSSVWILSDSSGPTWDQVGFTLPDGYARGDLLYVDVSGELAWLDVGTEGQVLTTDGTDFDWDDPSGGAPFILTATRDMADATGNVDYIGAGFNPSLVEVRFIVDGEAGQGFGYINGSGQASQYINYTGAAWTQPGGNFVAAFDGGASDSQSGVASLTTDGVRIAWTKSGSPTGTIKMILRMRP